MTEVPDIVRALRVQARICTQMGSPANGALLESAAQDWLAGGPVRSLLTPWQDQDLEAQFNAATPLRLIAGLRDLALSGDDPALAAAYALGDPAAIWSAALVAIARERDRLADFMAHEPQTNEVRRSICLVGGFMRIATATGLPLRCFEIGASAGLNLSWDRYGYQFGSARWGDAASPVQLDCDWTGPPPPIDAETRVVERAACDRRPTDLMDVAQRRRLLSYIWFDQRERVSRIQAAIDLAVRDAATVETADALDWVRRRVAPHPGAATVLYHSVFWQYLPVEGREALESEVRSIGSRATAAAPFAWLRMEPAPQNLASMQVRLTLWPTGDEVLLADVHPHGASVVWHGVPD